MAVNLNAFGYFKAKPNRRAIIEVRKVGLLKLNLLKFRQLCSTVNLCFMILFNFKLDFDARRNRKVFKSHIFILT